MFGGNDGERPKNWLNYLINRKKMMSAADTFYLDGSYPFCLKQATGPNEIGYLLVTCVLFGVLVGLAGGHGYFQLPSCLQVHKKHDEEQFLDQLIHHHEMAGFQGY